MATSTRADGRVGWCAGRASRLAGVNMFRPPPTRLHGDPADLGSRVTGIRGHRVLEVARGQRRYLVLINTGRSGRASPAPATVSGARTRPWRLISGFRLRVRTG
jgi:hypothetical protein